MAKDLHPTDNAHALIDRLVITGLSALVHGRWEPPRLYGRDRERWKLPEGLRPRVRQFAPLKQRFLLQKQALALDTRIFCGGTF